MLQLKPEVGSSAGSSPSAALAFSVLNLKLSLRFPTTIMGVLCVLFVHNFLWKSAWDITRVHPNAARCSDRDIPVRAKWTVFKVIHAKELGKQREFSCQLPAQTSPPPTNLLMSRTAKVFLCKQIQPLFFLLLFTDKDMRTKSTYLEEVFFFFFAYMVTMLVKPNPAIKVNKTK